MHLLISAIHTGKLNLSFIRYASPIEKKSAFALFAFAKFNRFSLRAKFNSRVFLNLTCIEKFSKNQEFYFLFFVGIFKGKIRRNHKILVLVFSMNLQAMKDIA